MPRGAYPHASAPLEDRFWRYVDPQDDGCWFWAGPRTSAGYGQIEVPGRKSAGLKRKVLYAHHVALWLTLGSWPVGQVNHDCDRPFCVNPGHLYPGSQQDNVDDMMRRGRYKNVSDRSVIP